MHCLRSLAKVLVIAGICILTPVVTHAATVEFRTDLPEGSALLEGDPVVVEVYALNMDRDAIASFQLFMKYDESKLSFQEATINEALFGLPLPVEAEEGILQIGGGTLGAGSTQTEILLATVEFSTLSSATATTTLTLSEESENGIFEMEGEEPMNILVDLAETTRSFAIGEYTPPTNVIPESTIEDTQEEESTEVSPEELEDLGTEEPEVIAETEDAEENEVPVLHGAAGSLLSAPEDLNYSTTTNSVSLSWKAVEGASGYYVYYSDDADTFLHRKKVLQTSALITGLEKNSDMYFIISAFNQSGEGERSVLIPLTVGWTQTLETTLPEPPVITQTALIPTADTQSQAALHNVATMPESGFALPLLLVLGGSSSIGVLVFKNRKKICK